MKKQNSTSIRFGILLIVLTLFFVGFILWWKDGMSPYEPENTKPILFVVNRGDTVRDVVSKLAKEQIVRSPTAFYLLVKFLGIERNLQAGEYRLNKGMDARTIALSLTHGMEDVWVTIVEGWRIEEIATKLAKELTIPEKEFLAIAEEGYMFPDTYRFPKEASASAVLTIVNKNFQQKVVETYATEIKKTGMTLHDIMTLASIVEREGNSDEDRPIIAGVLFNRLEKDWPLQTDATLQYAIGYQAKEKTWWKQMLTEDDKSVDSPFNTYINIGLPPAPIANPGLASIKAVLSPKKTEFMYYLHDTKGNVHFAKTLQEHEENISNFLK